MLSTASRRQRGRKRYRRGRGRLSVCSHLLTNDWQCSTVFGSTCAPHYVAFGLTALISPGHAHTEGRSHTDTHTHAHRMQDALSCSPADQQSHLRGLRSGNPVESSKPCTSNWVTNQPKYIMHRKLCGNYTHTHTLPGEGRGWCKRGGGAETVANLWRAV